MRIFNYFILLTFFSSSVYSQLNVNVQILPPYSVYFADYLNYPNKTLISIQNTSAQGYNYYLQGTISGDNGVEIASNASYKPSQPLYIAPYGIVTLSLSSLKDQFQSTASVQLKGVSYAYLYTKQAMPEGNYTVCLQAYDFNTGTAISSTSPLGCSTIFSLSYIQPPIITSPICENTVIGTSTPNIIFSWLPCVGVSTSLQYKLKIVEVIPSTRDINEAMNAATSPAFFEQTISGYSFIYGSGYLPFENGKKYAFQVQAMDLSNTYNLINNGKSEVCSFTYQSLFNTINTHTTITTEPTTFPGNTNLPLSFYSIKGNLKYYYESYKPEEKFDLSNTNVKLIVKYKFVPSKGETIFPSQAVLSEFNDNGKVIAQTQTDASGNFSFDYLKGESLGLVNASKTIFVNTGNVSTATTGQLYKVLQIQINDMRYCNPTETVDNLNSALINMGELFSRVRDFNLVFNLGSTPENISSGTSSNGSTSSSAVTNFNALNNSSALNNSINSSAFTSAYSSSYSNYELYNYYPQSENYYYSVSESNSFDFSSTQQYLSNEKEYEVKVYRKLEGGYSLNVFDIFGSGTNYNGMIEIASGKTVNGKLTLHRLMKNIESSDYYTLIIKPSNSTTAAELQYEFQFKYEAGEFETTGSSCPNITDYAYYNKEYISPDVSFSCIDKELLLATSQLSGKMEYYFPGSSVKKAFANKSIKLMVQYITKNGSAEQVLQGSGYDFPDNQSTIDITTTDANGNFVFTIFDLKEFGLVKKNVNIGYDPIDGVPMGYYKGDLYRCLRVIVNSGYYTSPSDNFTLSLGDNENVGTLYAGVRSYNLNVHLKSDSYEKNQYIPAGQGVKQMNVILMRTSRPGDVPQNEVNADDLNESFFGAEIIGKGITDVNGNISFYNLVKNQGSSDKYYVYAYPSDNGETNYNTTTKEVKYDCSTYSGYFTFPETAIYNTEYSVKSYNVEMIAYPNNPVIYGKVNRSDNPATYLKDVKVESYVLPIIPIPLEEAEAYTISNGEFRLSFSTNQYDSEGNLISLGRFLKLNLYGFDKKQVNNLGFLKKGQQQNVGVISLNPSGHVKGTISAEDGYPVKSYVTVGNGASVESDYGSVFVNFYTGTTSVSPAKFESAAALGSQNIIIEPINTNYFSTTSTVNITSTNQDVGNFTVYEKLHRIKINVKSSPSIVKTGGYYLPVSAVLKNAKLTIIDVSDTLLTDKDGNVEFKFTNSSDNFKIYIQGPDGYEYEAKTISVYNNESKYFQTINVQLEPAAKIYGKVLVGKSPIANARVFVEYGSPNLIETYTNSSGYYELHNVPRKDNIVIKAVKSSSNYIGATANVNTNTNNDSINLELKVYDKYDITQFWGIPIEVEYLEEIGGNVSLSGAFVNIPENSQFKLNTTSERLKFKNVVIKESVNKNDKGIPYAIPTVNTLTISERNYVDIVVNKKFKASQGDNVSGIQVTNLGSEKGGLKGKVWIKDISFTISDIDFTEDGFYLNLPVDYAAGDKINLVSLYAGGIDYYSLPKGFSCVNKSNTKIPFKIYSLTAEAATSNSYLKGDTLKLYSTIHTNVTSLTSPDIILTVGNISILSNKIIPINGTTEININIDSWKLNSKDWTLNKDGLLLKSGLLKASIVDVPFNTIYIKNDKLSYATTGTFTLSNIKLLSLIDVKAIGNCSFGNSGSKWQLAVTPGSGSSYAAEMSNIPDIGGKKLLLENFYLYSNGTNSFKLKTNSFKLNNLLDFNTNAVAMGIYSDYISLPGTVSLNVPMISPQPTSVMVKKVSASTLQTTLSTFGFMFNVNGIKADFSLGKTKLSSTGFTAEGSVSEPGLFSHNVILYKNADSTAISTTSGQHFQYSGSGSQHLANIWGRMYPTASSWSMYQFSGKVEGSPNLSGNLTFNVYGDISANDQKVSMDNFSTPFGNLSLSYDFANSRLTGNLNVSQSLGEGGSINANVECMFDNQGWYFVQGGTITMPNNPYIKNANSAILFGNYPNVTAIASINTIFNNFAYTHAVPAEFTNLKGFITNCSTTFPPPDIPEVDIDLVVVSGSLSVDVTAGFQTGLNFTPSKDFVYTIGSLYGVHVHAGVSGTVGLACAGASLDVTSTVSTAGTLATNGAWEVFGSANLSLTGSAYAGGGCCDSDCDDCCEICVITPCFTDDWSGTVSVGCEAHMDSNGNNYLKFTY